MTGDHLIGDTWAHKLSFSLKVIAGQETKKKKTLAGTTRHLPPELEPKVFGIEDLDKTTERLENSKIERQRPNVRLTGAVINQKVICSKLLLPFIIFLTPIRLETDFHILTDKFYLKKLYKAFI